MKCERYFLCSSVSPSPPQAYGRHQSLQFCPRYQRGAPPSELSLIQLGRKQTLPSSDDESRASGFYQPLNLLLSDLSGGKALSVCEPTGMSFGAVKAVGDFHAARVWSDLNLLLWKAGK